MPDLIRSIADRAAFTLFMVADMAVISPFYGQEAAWHFSVMEAGTLCHLLEEDAPRYGWGCANLGWQTFPLWHRIFNCRHIIAMSIAPWGARWGKRRQVLQHCCAISPPMRNRRETAAPLDMQSYKDAMLRGLRQQLPDYMVPSDLMLATDFPLTANGKLDRQKLQLQGEQIAHQRDGVGPIQVDSALQQRLVALWQEVLGVSHVSAEDDFFSLGAVL